MTEMIMADELVYRRSTVASSWYSVPFPTLILLFPTIQWYGAVVGTPALYLRDPVFESWPGNWLRWHFTSWATITSFNISYFPHHKMLPHPPLKCPQKSPCILLPEGQIAERCLWAFTTYRVSFHLYYLTR